MSSSLPHTVDQDADDDELCMVCDGKCTCSSQPVASTSTAPPPPPPVQQHLPKLKIKLPPKIPSGLPPDLPNQLVAPQPQPQPKRRGRPPKNGISAAPRSRPKPSAPPRRPPPKKQIKNGIKKRQLAVKRKRVDSTDDDSSDLTDIDQFYPEHRPIPHHDEDASSAAAFPTFASSISSTSSTDSDSSSSSGFETDSSIEAEEENFIIAEERARVRRELMGEETLQRRRDNDWVIRPRKRSVGTPSDVDMDGDSDATEGEEDDDDDDAQDDEPADDDDEQDESDRPGAGYVGLATGWSEDESSFDADLFFANLSSNSDSDGSSTEGDDEGGIDGDYSDLDAFTEAAASLIPHLRQSITNLPFEVSEGWDGQIVFTNGLGEVPGAVTLDVPFPPSPILLPEQSASPSADGDGDVDMISTTDADPDEEGYEQDVDTVGEGDGDTTDEELVGEDDLPNERAMQLFNTPFTSVSYINPLSTMSPVASPGPKRGYAPFGVDSPKPADILAGRMYWDSDEPDDLEDDTGKRASSSKSGGPRQGQFEVTEETRRAVIIDGQHSDIPSPHPRFKGRHNRLSASQSIGLESLLRRTLQPIRPSSLPPSTRFPLNPSSSSEVAQTSPELLPTQAVDIDDVLDSSFLDNDPPMDSDSQECGDGEDSSTDSAFEPEDSRKHIRNLKRWDLISVGAFRKTREAVGGGCLSDSAPGWDAESPADYSSAMKSSPLNAMLWPNRNGQQTHAPHAQASTSRLPYALSPELSPVADGDRTPTDGSSHHANARTPVKAPGGNGYTQHQHEQQNPNKSRKEIRRERRLKQKSFAAASRHQQNRTHHHHFHQHHPNSKSRSTGSTQRTNFFSSPSSMPSPGL
ncbi:hypothetical protein V5O48_001412 [Marasmius crinis-equi]|uniref:Uncharacterized protein n=1 Tax=Marasmius crinis-equi TaxID=585013 RepID=A0ABR3FYU6_9AGAR